MVSVASSSAVPAESKAWRLAKPGGALEFLSVPTPQVRAGTVLVRMLASPLLSYLGDYAAGKLPYWYPGHPFTPGTNGIGIVVATGEDVYQLTVGQRVAVHPHLVANEMVDEPTQALIGLTGISADSGAMIDTWADGTLREYVLMPASTVAPLDGLEAFSAERLATLGKFAVPLGGLLRGRLAQGETLVVNGATGYFGSAAVLLGLALGAERVIAAGRSKAGLDALARIGGTRVQGVVLSGDIEADRAAIRSAAGPRGPHMAFDQVGRATDASSTLAALRAVRRGGRMVLMGSMSAPLPISYGEFMQNDWELIGNFMYRPAAFNVLKSLIRSNLLDLDAVTIRSFALPDLRQAIDAAARMSGLDCTVVMMEQ
ncbi:quinone oxidoreductase family protein [Methylovirgula sp. 4M-Z18]|uniref:quinone oxidoreductase family protein n=1 Tax=Methylovirgula sp. 4M-Z18 TaxID=2293567 RepID=UPI000E2FBE2C|nr:zinc-binding alcohol dehydrogenase family protein [Methylovirgula sp. 4M-Z18]RFB79364.1 zinc-binding alcohol dehydrogenase family protein [Methylovirgula sp. 4M-Z18]